MSNIFTFRFKINLLQVVTARLFSNNPWPTYKSNSHIYNDAKSRIADMQGDPGRNCKQKKDQERRRPLGDPDEAWFTYLDAGKKNSQEKRVVCEKPWLAHGRHRKYFIYIYMYIFSYILAVSCHLNNFVFSTAVRRHLCWLIWRHKLCSDLRQSRLEATLLQSGAQINVLTVKLKAKDNACFQHFHYYKYERKRLITLIVMMCRLHPL